MGCERAEPPTKDPLVGFWGDKHHIFSFYDNGTCSLIAENFNVAASYVSANGKIKLSEMRMQYKAPGFIKLKGTTAEFQQEGSGALLRVLDSGSQLFKGTLVLTRLESKEANALIATISGRHRSAIRSQTSKL